MTDAVLAVDGLEVKEGLKILIVGSSHEPGVVPRSAYFPLFFMVTKSEFDLYDPFEIEEEDEINSNIIRRHKTAYMYKDMANYDLIIDDAWSTLGTSVEKYMLDHDFQEFLDEYPLNYSLKMFKRVLPGRYYMQVGATFSGEMRYVSRPMVPCYNHNIVDKVGQCAYCRELVYNLLSDKYVPMFWSAISLAHRIEDRVSSNIKENRAWYSRRAVVDWRECARPDNAYILFEDYRARGMGYPCIERRIDHVMNKSIVITEDSVLTNLVVGYASHIYKYENNVYYEAMPCHDIVWEKDNDEYEEYPYVKYQTEWLTLPCIERNELAAVYTLVLENRNQYRQLHISAMLWFKNIRCGPYKAKMVFARSTTVAEYIHRAREARMDKESRYKNQMNIYSSNIAEDYERSVTNENNVMYQHSQGDYQRWVREKIDKEIQEELS